DKLFAHALESNSPYRDFYSDTMNHFGLDKQALHVKIQALQEQVAALKARIRDQSSVPRSDRRQARRESDELEKVITQLKKQQIEEARTLMVSESNVFAILTKQLDKARRG